MSKLLLDCRQGWPVSQYRVDGWRSQIVHTSLHGRKPVESEVKAVIESHPDDQLVILDIEHWKLPADMDEAIQVVDWVRQVKPQLRVGYYGIIPMLAYWPSITKGEQEQKWKLYNASLGRSRNAKGHFDARGLIDVVDFIAPSLYSFYPNTGTWDHEGLWFSNYAPATIEACRNYQKEVYPFIWQRVHPGGKGGPILPDDHFSAQIQYCLDNADGVCIWDWADTQTGTDVLARTSGVMKRFH